MLKHLKIFHKILLSSLLIGGIPLAGFCYQVSINGENQRSVVEKDLWQTANYLGGTVGDWIDKNLKNTRLLARLDAFRSLDPERMVPLLKAAKENLSWVSLVFVADTNGNAVARSDDKPLKNYSDREYFRQVINGSDIGQQVLIGKVKPVPLHCFSIPISERPDVVTGLVTQCSTLVAITDVVAQARIGRTGFAVLVDSRNRLIAHGGNETAVKETLQDLSGHPALTLAPNQVHRIEHDGEDRVFIARPVGSGWTLIVQQDYAEAYADYLDARSTAIYLVIITLTTTLVLALVISLNLASPLKQLTAAAIACSKGKNLDEINALASESRRDEVGDLSQAIFRLSQSIQIAMSRIRQERETQTS